jgi:hypothetical protein
LKLSRVSFVLVAALGLGIGASAAAPKSVSGLTFEAPADPAWKEEKIEAGIIYQWQFANPENGHQATAMLLVTAAPFFRGDINQALIQLMDSAGILKGESPTQSHSGTTTDGLPMAWAMRAGSTGEQWGSAVVAVVAMQRPQGLASAFMILVNVDDQSREKVEAAWDGVVASLDFGGGLRPALPTPVAGTQSLEGPYVYTVTSFGQNPMGGTSMQYNWKLRQFAPNGMYADRLPLAGETLESVCAKAPDACGTYVIDGDQVTFNEVKRFGIVEAGRAKTIKPTDRGFSVGGMPYEPAQGVPTPTLSGSWRYNNYATGPGGSMTLIRQIDFTADGRYKRTGFAGVTVDNPVAGISSTSSGTDPEQMGRYEIDGLTLKLTSDAGETEAMSLVAVNPADLSFLFIDSDNYARVTE